jgi:hypothetical protein
MITPHFAVPVLVCDWISGGGTHITKIRHCWEVGDPRIRRSLRVKHFPANRSPTSPRLSFETNSCFGVPPSLDAGGLRCLEQTQITGEVRRCLLRGPAKCADHQSTICTIPAQLRLNELKPSFGAHLRIPWHPLLRTTKFLFSVMPQSVNLRQGLR